MTEDGTQHNHPHQHHYSLITKHLTKRCKVCAKKPLRLTTAGADVNGVAFHNLADNGFLELIDEYSIRNQQEFADTATNSNGHGFRSVNKDQAGDIVERAARKVKEFEAQRQYNIERYAPEDSNVYQENGDAMGFFDWNELKIGALLGVGGFSHVSEIKGFRLNHKNSSNNTHCTKRSCCNEATGTGATGNASVSRAVSEALSDASEQEQQQQQQQQQDEDPMHRFTEKQRVARKFLAKHAKRPAPATGINQEEDLSGSRYSQSESHNNRKHKSCYHKSRHHQNEQQHPPKEETCRYAVKHLQPRLSERCDQRTFNCAAVDLILEAHFLMSLQHPNIIKIRGLAADGPQGYLKGGRHHGYFLILDQLPETMEYRLCFWRKQVKKIKRKSRLHGHNLLLAPVVKTVLRLRHKDNVANINANASNNTAPASIHDQQLQQLLQERYRVAYEISDAMEYLHDRRILNRDLKIANLGFDIRGDVKLFDLGLSRWMPPSKLNDGNDNDNANGSAKESQNYLDEAFRMSTVGTKLYMAPEVRAKTPYSAKCDVYSFGIVLWEMLALSDPIWCKPPSDKRHIQKAAQQLPHKIPLCPCWPEPLQQLLQKCVSPTPTERPTFTDIKSIFRDQLLLHNDEEDNSCQLLLADNPHGLVFSDEDDIDNDDEEDDGDSSSAGSHHHHHHPKEHKRIHDGNNKARHQYAAEENNHVAPNTVIRRRVPARRRSTFVLNFADLSWLSSSLRSSTSKGVSRRSFTAGTEREREREAAAAAAAVANKKKQS